MYGKIFTSIYDGTLAEDWRALITFQQLIVLCDADGIIDMTPQSISRRTGIPIEHIKAGIDILEKADKYSRTPDEDGKRIELIDDHRPWGWHIVNHEMYKKLQDADTIREQTRERVRKHREKKRAVTDGNVQKRHIDTDIDIKTTISKTPSRFDDFWEIYPTKKEKKKTLEIWKRRKLDQYADKLIKDVADRMMNDKNWIDGYIPNPTTYINGDRWEDEIKIKSEQTDYGSQAI